MYRALIFVVAIATVTADSMEDRANSLADPETMANIEAAAASGNSYIPTACYSHNDHASQVGENCAMGTSDRVRSCLTAEAMEQPMLAYLEFRYPKAHCNKEGVCADNLVTGDSCTMPGATGSGECGSGNICRGPVDDPHCVISKALKVGHNCSNDIEVEYPHECPDAAYCYSPFTEDNKGWCFGGTVGTPCEGTEFCSGTLVCSSGACAFPDECSSASDCGFPNFNVECEDSECQFITDSDTSLDENNQVRTKVTKRCHNSLPNCEEDTYCVRDAPENYDEHVNGTCTAEASLPNGDYCSGQSMACQSHRSNSAGYCVAPPANGTVCVVANAGGPYSTSQVCNYDEDCLCGDGMFVIAGHGYCRDFFQGCRATSDLLMECMEDCTSTGESHAWCANNTCSEDHTAYVACDVGTTKWYPLAFEHAAIALSFALGLAALVIGALAFMMACPTMTAVCMMKKDKPSATSTKSAEAAPTAV